MSKKGCQWFIAPTLGTETNEKLAAHLFREGIITEGQEMDRIIVNKKPVRVWNVPYRIVTDLTNLSKVFPFGFRVFVKEGDGKWRQFFLHEKKRISLKSKKAMERLQELIAKKKA